MLDLAIFENFFDVTKLKKKEEKRKNWKLAPACLLTKRSCLFTPRHLQEGSSTRAQGEDSPYLIPRQDYRKKELPMFPPIPVELLPILLLENGKSFSEGLSSSSGLLEAAPYSWVDPSRLSLDFRSFLGIFLSSNLIQGPAFIDSLNNLVNALP